MSLVYGSLRDPPGTRRSWCTGPCGTLLVLGPWCTGPYGTLLVLESWCTGPYGTLCILEYSVYGSLRDPLYTGIPCVRVPTGPFYIPNRQMYGSLRDPFTSPSTARLTGPYGTLLSPPHRITWARQGDTGPHVRSGLTLVYA